MWASSRIYLTQAFISPTLFTLALDIAGDPSQSTAAAPTTIPTAPIAAIASPLIPPISAFAPAADLLLEAAAALLEAVLMLAADIDDAILLLAEVMLVAMLADPEVTLMLARDALTDERLIEALPDAEAERDTETEPEGASPAHSACWSWRAVAWSVALQVLRVSTARYSRPRAPRGPKGSR